MNKTLTLHTPAKINLTLEVLDKRSDGFFNLRSVISTIPIYDKVEITLNDKKKSEPPIKITCANKDIPMDKKNTCYRAAQIMLKKSMRNKTKVAIKIFKNIPISAGLGGSSTDGAAVLLGLNKLLYLNLSRLKLTKLAIEIGSDVGLFLFNGLVFLRGKGEKITTLSQAPLNLPLLLIISPDKWSSKKAYRGYTPQINPENRVDISNRLIQNLKNKKCEKTAFFLHNDLEISQNIDREYLTKTKNILINTGALNALLSGSGPTIYGIYPNNYTLRKAVRVLKKNYKLITIFQK